MENSGPLALSYARGGAVRAELCDKLPELDFPYVGNSPIPSIQEWVMSRNFFGMPGQHLYRRSNRPVLIPEDKKQEYEARFMPPIQSSWVAQQMRWCVAVCDAGQTVQGDKVRGIADRRAKWLIKDFNTKPPTRVTQPNRYFPLEVTRRQSRAWLSMHLKVVQDRQRSNYCSHCGRSDSQCFWSYTAAVPWLLALTNGFGKPTGLSIVSNATAL